MKTSKYKITVRFNNGTKFIIKNRFDDDDINFIIEFIRKAFTEDHQGNILIAGSVIRLTNLSSITIKKVWF